MIKLLINEKSFKNIEEALIKDGTMDEFKEKHGEVKGRMMINILETPEAIGINIKNKENTYVFQATFDFLDISLAMALNTSTMRAESGIIYLEQKPGAKKPHKHWVEFFVQTIVNHINPDGSFGYPMYTFLYEVGDFTVISVETEETK